ncbi:MAG: spondin domain-containing protein [Bacteroidota bacterium]
MIKNVIVLFLIGLLFSECEDATPDTSANFQITIENLSSGENTVLLSDGIYLLKQDGFPLYFPNSQDFGRGLEGLAEDGVVTELVANLQDDPNVMEVASFGAIPAGSSVVLNFSASYGTFFNFATMFTESNDLFYSFNEDGVPLFQPDGEPFNGDLTSLVWLWDLGTEINQVPYLGNFQPGRQAFNGEGIDENGRLRLVNDEFTYPGKFSIIRVTITPI